MLHSRHQIVALQRTDCSQCSCTCLACLSVLGLTHGMHGQHKSPLPLSSCFHATAWSNYTAKKSCAHQQQWDNLSKQWVNSRKSCFAQTYECASHQALTVPSPKQTFVQHQPTQHNTQPQQPTKDQHDAQTLWLQHTAHRLAISRQRSTPSMVAPGLSERYPQGCISLVKK